MPNKPDAPENSIQDLERIREIIFGSQIRDYEVRFTALTRDLERLQQNLDHLTTQLAEQETSQNKKVQALRNELREADDNTRAELREAVQRLSDEKMDRVTLGNMFIELGTQLKGGGGLADF